MHKFRNTDGPLRFEYIWDLWEPGRVTIDFLKNILYHRVWVSEIWCSHGGRVEDICSLICYARRSLEERNNPEDNFFYLVIDSISEKLLPPYINPWSFMYFQQ